MNKYINESLLKEQRLGEVGVNKKGEKMTIIRYGNANDIDVEFNEDEVVVKNRTYAGFKKGTIKHPIRYKESFAYHIEIELGIDLNEIWNWEKNNENGINPYKIYKSSMTKIYLYCLEHDYHNYDREGNKVGYEITCNHFYQGRRCGYCGSHKVHYKDSLAYNYPNITKMIVIKENKLTFEDCYNIACKSGKKFYFKCPNCGTISNKKLQLNNITHRGYACEFCSDGINVPERFMGSVLKELNVEFQTQLNKSIFDWCENYKYDFYIPTLNMIIEVHGEQHYKENSNWVRTLTEEQLNDRCKKHLAKKNGIKRYYTIDCRYSDFEYMKNNITKTLGHLFDLSKVDWELAWGECQNSLCVKTWDLWNSGVHSIKEIVCILKLSRGAIYKYLKRGAEIGKCDYMSKKYKICNVKSQKIF